VTSITQRRRQESNHGSGRQRGERKNGRAQRGTQRTIDEGDQEESLRAATRASSEEERRKPKSAWTLCGRGGLLFI